MTDSIPVGATYVSGGSRDGSIVTWTRSELARIVTQPYPTSSWSKTQEPLSMITMVWLPTVAFERSWQRFCHDACWQSDFEYYQERPGNGIYQRTIYLRVDRDEQWHADCDRSGDHRYYSGRCDLCQRHAGWGSHHLGDIRNWFPVMTHPCSLQSGLKIRHHQQR